MSATNRGATRNAQDFYATPKSAFDPLIKFLPADVSFWEPACGDGRLINWLKNSGRKADGTDLSYGHNFLEDQVKREFIITNPPFSLALEFCSHALELAPQVVMLLRLNFLASKKRKAWWKENEPAALFVLSERPSFTGKGTDACDYAWFYWSKLNPVYKGIYHL